MVKRALKKLHGTPATTLIIGDDTRDELLAKRCGTQFYKLATNAAVASLAKRLL